MLAELQHAREIAVLSGDGAVARRNYRIVRDGTGLLLSTFDERAVPSPPLPFVELCFLRNDIQCILDRPDDALWLAKMGRVLLDHLTPAACRLDPPAFNDLKVQALCAESLACRNMGLGREAFAAYRRAEDLQTAHPGTGRWEAHIYLGLLKSLAHARFTLNEVDTLVGRATEARGAVVGDGKVAQRFVFEENVARAYVAYGSPRALKKAGRLLDTNYSRMEGIDDLGGVWRASFLRTYARWHWRCGDRDGCEHALTQAVRVAAAGGLHHQLRTIREEYRGEQTLLEKLGMAVAE